LDDAWRRRWKGCSSFHVWWQGVPHHEQIVSVAATVEVLAVPADDHLRFWALQASFVDSRTGRRYGGAHTGLQWYRKAPGHTAVNWGGYADPPVGGVLSGTGSQFGSLPGEEHTFAYPWQVGVPERFVIARGPGGGWGAWVSGELIRELDAGGDRLADPVVWAELFSPCDAEESAVRWSAFEATLADGSVVRPTGGRLTFPAGGNCPNTNIEQDDSGVVLMSGVARRHRDHEAITFRPG
jgi:hypothetical protein